MADQALMKAQPGALVRNTIDPQALLQAAVEGGAGVDQLERLVALAREVRADQAKEAWHLAMAQFQAKCPAIKKSKDVNAGRFSYSYAPLGEIMSTILPVMGPLGLSVSYRVRQDEKQVVAICRISHESGHYEESGDVSMPIVFADPTSGANPAQRVGIANTYAKRYALLAIIGLAPEDDADGAPVQRQAPPPVAMPQRKSAAAPAAKPAATAPRSSPAPQPSGPEPTEGTWIGKLQGVSEEQGRTGERDWTRYDLNIGGEAIVTFSSTLAALAREALDAQMMVCIDWKRGKYGKVVKPGTDEAPTIYPASDDDIPSV